MTDKPQLGRLPRPPERLVASLRPRPPELLPVYPTEVHNIERDTSTDMLGNDVWGDCVFASIENHRRIAALALGAPITWLTAQQVVDKYCAYTGIYSAPGPGAVIVDALNWVRKNPAGWGGNHLLYFADVPLTEDDVRHSCFEFQSLISGEVIRAAQEYPAAVWDHTTTSVLGGHATAGGTYTSLYDFLKTWGYMVEVTDSFFTHDIDEVLVVVWDFQWESLSYDRQLALVADIEELTGQPWTGPAPTQPPGAVMAVTTKDSAIEPLRVLDTRKGLGLSGPFTPGMPRRVQITGGAVPASALAVDANLTVTGQNAKGYLAIGPTAKPAPTTSTLNFPAADDRANAVPGLALDATGGAFITYVGPAGSSAQAILDVLGFKEP